MTQPPDLLPPALTSEMQQRLLLEQYRAQQFCAKERMTRAPILISGLLLLFALSSCVRLERYRTDYAPCLSADAEQDCRTSAIQRQPAEESKDAGFTLGIIEFDDQGQLFKREQMQAVLEEIAKPDDAVNPDSLVVVFVHGWKHNASPDDPNLLSFRNALLHLSRTEYRLSQGKRTPRRVVGVYLGWRGSSISPEPLNEFTFWDRKNTAHKVGHGEVTEVLTRLEQIRRDRDRATPGGHSESRLIVVGHSFGGAVVYSAVEQILADQFVHSASDIAGDGTIQGFGSLVVLINPAFEAQLYAPLSDLSNEHASYVTAQLPVLAILTSEADSATGFFFPAGRWFSTRFEKELKEERWNPVSQSKEIIDEHRTNVAAVGHYEPYRTHFLHATEDTKPSKNLAPVSPTESAQSFGRTSKGWESDHPGSKIEFSGSRLERTSRSAGRDPYLVVEVDKKLIPNHNDIWDPRVSEFITQLILISSQDKEISKRPSERRVTSD